MNRKELNVWLLLTGATIAALFFLLINAEWDILRYSVTDVDVAQIAWNTDHFAWCIRNFRNPYYTDVLFQPHGESLLMHSYSQYYGLINLFVKDIPLSINIGVFLSFMFCGAGFFLLGNRFGLNGASCFALGLFSVFNFYSLNKYGIHLHLVCYWVLPFAIMSWLDIRGFHFVLPTRKSKLIEFAVWILLAWFCDYYALFYCLSFAVLHLLYIYSERLKLKYKPSGWKLLAGILIILFSCHFISRGFWLSGFENKGGISGSPDLRALFIPYFDGSPEPDYSKFELYLSTENYVFTGYILSFLFLIALGIKLRNRINGYAAFFLFIIICYLLIIFPDFRVGSSHLFFTPFSFSHYIPFIKEMRATGRFIEMLFVFVPLFVFYILQKIPLKLSLLKMVLPLLAFTVSIFEFARPELKVYDVKQRIADARIKDYNLKDASVLQIPFCRGDGMQQFGYFNQDDYFFQIANRCKIWGGYIARMSDRTAEITKSDPFLKEVVFACVPACMGLDSDLSAIETESLPEYIVIDKKKALYISMTLRWLKPGGYKDVYENYRYRVLRLMR